MFISLGGFGLGAFFLWSHPLQADRSHRMCIRGANARHDRRDDNKLTHLPTKEKSSQRQSQEPINGIRNKATPIKVFLDFY